MSKRFFVIVTASILVHVGSLTSASAVPWCHQGTIYESQPITLTGSQLQNLESQYPNSHSNQAAKASYLAGQYCAATYSVAAPQSSNSDAGKALLLNGDVLGPSGWLTAINYPGPRGNDFYTMEEGLTFKCSRCEEDFTQDPYGLLTVEKSIHPSSAPIPAGTQFEIDVACTPSGPNTTIVLPGDNSHNLIVPLGSTCSISEGTLPAAPDGCYWDVTYPQQSATLDPGTDVATVEARNRLICEPREQGLIKVCKVAGAGVAIGTDFTFGATGAPNATVPAGPAPGGYCWPVGAQFNVGDQVDITELGPAGYDVVDIDVQPGGRLIGTPNLSGKTVSVVAGPGITEVTFTNERRFGYLEICKEGNVEGLFDFEILPGNIPVTVPAGACSPAIEVPAGSITINESPNPNSGLTGCRTIPVSRQGDCNLAGPSSTVEVVAGDISTQTIVFFENTEGVSYDDDDGGGRQEFSSLLMNSERELFLKVPNGNDVVFAVPESARISCDTTVSQLFQMKACTAEISATSMHAPQTPGTVHFYAGGETVAIVPIKADGTATLAVPSNFNVSDMTASFIAHKIAGELTGQSHNQPDYKKYKPGEISPTDNEAARLNVEQTDRLLDH